MFSPKKNRNFVKCFVCFSNKQMIKNLIFNKNKNASVRFLIYISSKYVQLFTAFEDAVLMYLGECTKIEYGRHFHGNQTREKKNWCFLPICSY